jgi:hypothetical protein
MRWEVRPKAMLLLCLTGLLLALPLLASLVGREFLRSSVGLVGEAMRDHGFREATGYLALSAVAFQLLLSARKRSTLVRKGSYAGWRAAHMLAGVGLILLIVVHTGGRWGVNLNGMLLSAFALVTVVGLTGKLAEAWMVERLSQRPERAAPFAWKGVLGAGGRPGTSLAPSDERGRAPVVRAPGSTTATLTALPLRNATWGPRRRVSSVAYVRTIWVGAHVLVTAALLALLLFHVLSVYYF